MKQSTKIKYKEHTKIRYYERYFDQKKSDFQLTDEYYVELCNVCEKEDGILLYQRGHIIKKIINFKNKHIICVYDNKNRIIRTVLYLNEKLKKKT